MTTYWSQKAYSCTAVIFILTKYENKEKQENTPYNFVCWETKPLLVLGLCRVQENIEFESNSFSSLAFIIGLAEFFSLNRPQLAWVLRRLHPTESRLQPGLSTGCLILKLEVMLELHADARAVIESKTCLFQSKHPLPIQKLFEQGRRSQIKTNFPL